MSSKKGPASKQPSTSMKHQNFVSEPMRDKHVTEIPGVGKVLGGRLESKGYVQASSVMGQYNALNQNEGKFKEWYQSTSYANSNQAKETCKAIKEWNDNFV